MKGVYRALAFLVSLGVLVQAGSIAYGWFQVINEVEAGTLTTLGEEMRNAGHVVHGTNGMMVIPIIALLLLIVSFFARIPGGVKWAAIVFGLVVLQVVLAFVAFGLPIVGALHGINALAILAASGYAGGRVRRSGTAGARTGEDASTARVA